MNIFYAKLPADVAEKGDVTTPAPPSGHDASSDGIIADARRAAASFGEEMPGIAALQRTTRNGVPRAGGKARKVDEITADLSVVGGKDEHHNFKVNGKAIGQPPEESGAWSQGEFQTTLRTLFAPATSATFSQHGEDRVSGEAWVFDLAVDQAHSNWTLAAGGRRYLPAYTGTVRIDKETHRVLRIDMQAQGIPTGFALDKVESSLEYGFVTLDGHSYLLPVKSVSSACSDRSAECVRNVTEFLNYRLIGQAQ